MKRSIKKKGSDFERRVRKHLESHGWIVFRSAGSRTCADLVGLKRLARGSRILLVQCKASGEPVLDPDERSNLISMRDTLGARALVVGRDNRNFRFKFFTFRENSDTLIEVMPVL